MVSKARADASFGDDIHLIAKQIFQILPEAYEVQKTVFWLHLHQEVKVAFGSIFAPSNRTEYTDVAGSVGLS